MDYISFLNNFLPPQAVVAIVGMLPVSELRGAIPLGIGFYQMSIKEVFFWSVLGNIIPPLFLVFFLEKLAQILSAKSQFFRNFFNWLFERTRKRAEEKIKKFGYWGLFVLVAIPLPMTGAWTGSIASFLLGLDKKISIPVIFLGIITAGIAVLLLIVGAKSIILMI